VDDPHAHLSFPWVVQRERRAQRNLRHAMRARLPRRLPARPLTRRREPGRSSVARRTAPPSRDGPARPSDDDDPDLGRCDAACSAWSDAELAPPRASHLQRHGEACRWAWKGGRRV
jgi:hypothetical protein